MSKNFDRKNETLVNEGIRFEEVLVIDDAGETLGVMKPADAIKAARAKNFDLVCVAANAKTPVCRFADYSRLRYEQQKKAREAKRNQHTVTVKEIWVTPVINQNDLETKIRAGRKFLAEGNKLKVTLKYRSFRMLNLDGPNQSVLDKYYECISDMAILEQRPILEGKNMTMILVPKKEIKKNKECN